MTDRRIAEHPAGQGAERGSGEEVTPQQHRIAEPPNQPG